MAGLYIHIPYCHSKCYYCDFYSVPDRSTVDSYIKSVVAEAKLRRNELTEPLRTVYVGGGTPSSLSIESFNALVDGIAAVFPLGDVEEFTVEVNPEDVTAELLDGFRANGVNRISMGVQSLVDDELKRVGRRHTAARAIEAARAVASRFENFSLDLIYGLPRQTIYSLNYSIDRLLEFNPPHLSAYLLSYEPGTRLYARLLAGKESEADEELAEAMFTQVHESLSRAGFEHYEVSNFARQGYESRHNSAYWNSTPYLGLGVAAHSFDGNVRRYNKSNINEYNSALQVGKVCYQVDEETLENRFNDYIITRLRTRRGIDMQELATKPYGHFINTLHDEIMRLSKAQLITIDGRYITIPVHHWLMSDAIMRQLIV